MAILQMGKTEAQGEEEAYIPQITQFKSMGTNILTQL